MSKSIPAIEQKERAKHGEQMFPLKKYLTKLDSDFPVVMPHWHEEAEFTLITSGTCRYRIHLETYAAKSGDLLFLPPLMLHSIEHSGSCSMRSETYVFHLNFLGAAAGDVCTARYLAPVENRELILPFRISQDHPVYPELLSVFCAISQTYEKKTFGYELTLRALFLKLLVLLLPYGRSEKNVPPLQAEHSEKLKTVLEYISQHYSEELTIPELASLCCFSEYHFMRFFKKHVGMTCLNYIKNLRLEKAAALLLSGERSALEVSLSSGFNNLSYFHREFKKKYGTTPQRFLSSRKEVGRTLPLSFSPTDTQAPG